MRGERDEGGRLRFLACIVPLTPHFACLVRVPDGRELALSPVMAPWLRKAAAASNFLSSAYLLWYFVATPRWLVPGLGLISWSFLLWGLIWLLRKGNGPDRLIASVLALAAICYLAIVGAPGLVGTMSAMEYRSLLAAELGRTVGGFPVYGSLAMLGALAWGHLTVRLVGRGPQAALIGSLVALFGLSTILGYATGSPLPWGP